MFALWIKLIQDALWNMRIAIDAECSSNRYALYAVQVLSINRTRWQSATTNWNRNGND